MLRAAAALADGEGLKHLTLTRLALRLGVRTPSLYNHVAGLEALRRGLALLGLRELAAYLGHVAVSKAADQAVYALADAYRAFAHEHPGLYAAAMCAPDPADAEWQAASIDLVQIVVAVLAAYDLHGDDALHTARALRSLAHGFVSLEAAAAFDPALDRDKSFRRLVEIFIAGLVGGRAS